MIDQLDSTFAPTTEFPYGGVPKNELSQPEMATTEAHAASPTHSESDQRSLKADQRHLGRRTKT